MWQLPKTPSDILAELLYVVQEVQPQALRYFLTGAPWLPGESEGLENEGSDNVLFLVFCDIAKNLS